LQLVYQVASSCNTGYGENVEIIEPTEIGAQLKEKEKNTMISP
jgi:hypothetical protein